MSIHPKSTKMSRLRISLLALLGLFAAAILGGGVFVYSVATHLPQWDPNSLSNVKQASIVYDKEGKEIAELHGSTNRLVLPSANIPDLLKKTFVAVEDKRFYQHIGVDPYRIISSAISDIMSGSAKEGASTITQQLARNAFIDNPTAKTLTRKVQEALIAIQLERHYTKDEILTFYLNKIPLGESSYGIETASKTYFGKDVNQLDPAEIALLAGLPQAPSGYDPYYHETQAKNRRNIVLGVMRDAQLITKPEYDKYKDEPFTYVDSMIKTYGGPQKALAAEGNYNYPSFVDYVVDQLENEYGLNPDQIFNGGLKIYTTVDGKIQTAAEEAFNNPANFPKSFDKSLVQGAMTVVEPSTGNIVAMVGGRNYKFGDFDRAWQAQRQPGSAIKPLVEYGAAIEKGGYFPGTVLDDMPVSYSMGNGQKWSPIDFDTPTGGWKGLITMRYALEDSVNVYAVKLLKAIGIETGWDFGKKLGLPLTDQDKQLSLALGTARVSTVNMASAYGVYANNGVKVTPHAISKVLDSRGIPVLDIQTQTNQVMKATTAYIINDMLRSVVTNGTAYAARIGNWAVAGKTGTTSLDPAKYGNIPGNTDAWFAGYTSDYAGVVWMGYDSDPDGHHYLHQVYGGSYPAQIWKKVMTVALQGKPVKTAFNRPDGIVSGQIDSKSGLLPSPLTPPQFIQTEIATQGDFPTQVSNIWVQAVPGNLNAAINNGIATWDKVYLNVPDRDPSWSWPSDEAPYRMPAGFVIINQADPQGDMTQTQPAAGSLPEDGLNQNQINPPQSQYSTPTPPQNGSSDTLTPGNPNQTPSKHGHKSVRGG